MPLKEFARIIKKNVDNPSSIINEIEASAKKALEVFNKMVLDKKLPEDQIISIFIELIENANGNSSLIDEAFLQLAKHTSSEKPLLPKLILKLKDTLPASEFEKVTHSIFAVFPNAIKIFENLLGTIMKSSNDIFDDVNSLISPLITTLINQSEETAKGSANVLIDFLVANTNHLPTVDPLEVLNSAENNFLSNEILAQGALSLNKPIWIVTLFLDRLFSSVDLLQEGQSTLNKFPLLNQVFNFKHGLNKLPVNKKFALLFVNEFITRARKDKNAEWQLLQIARYTPVGIVLILLSIVVCATDLKGITSDTGFFLDLIGKDIEAKNSGYKVKRLPQEIVKERQGDIVIEKTKHKYLILSDIHRDELDDLRPRFKKGAVDHFMRNADLYMRILEYADSNGYTVIEAGDCEELWFHNDFSKRPSDKLKSILKTHHKIYEKLKKLHQQKRYFRTFGNHDSYLRDKATRKVLNDFFGQDFEIFDFIIIEGVKTMQAPFHDIHIGLDSAPYTERAPMIVTHGHHWDFWNCDRNNIIGKLIVSAVVTPIDMIDDILQDIGGISVSGSPFFNLKSKIASLPIFNSWPTKNVSKKWSYKVAHQADTGRRLNDSIYYFETLTALLAETLKVKKGNDEGAPLFCMGHTHVPQAQPYLDIFDFFPKALKNGVNTALGAVSFGTLSTDQFLIKTNYFNAGVAGWNDGIIWAVDIGEYGGNTGQAKLIFWDEDNTVDGAQMMHWELPYMNDQHRKELHNTAVSKWLEFIKNLPSEITDKLNENSYQSISLTSLLKEASQIKNDVINLKSTDTVAKKISGIQAQFVKALLCFLNGDHREFILSYKFNNEMVKEIDRIRQLLNVFPGVTNETMDSAAMVWLFMKNNSRMLLGKNQGIEDFESDLVFSILTLLTFTFPKKGALQCQTSIQNSELKLTLKVNGKQQKETLIKGLSLRQSLKKQQGTIHLRNLIFKTGNSLRQKLKHL